MPNKKLKCILIHILAYIKGCSTVKCYIFRYSSDYDIDSREMLMIDYQTRIGRGKNL